MVNYLGNIYSNQQFKLRERIKVSKRLHEMVKNKINPSLDDMIHHGNIFSRGDPIDIGFLKFNKQYSNTLKRISILGADAFYKGDIAKDIVELLDQLKIIQDFYQCQICMNIKQKKRSICLNYR